MKESPLANKSLDFAIDIVNLTKQLLDKKEYVLSNQIERSGTSIGANIREANYAQSRMDFISKLQIALKECNETDYWLELLFKTEYIDNECFDDLKSKCHSIRAMLVKSINTAKESL